MFKRLSLLISVFILLIVTTNTFAGTVELPQTGQTKCYDTTGIEIACAGTGQDGEIRAGVPWPNPRFEITYCDATDPCADQSSDCDANASTDVVIDKLTGLMWARNGNLKGTREDWESALEYTNNLTLCGYSDWHLPNVNEIESLVNLDVSTPATWLNNNGFINVQSGFYSYLSSTTSAFNTDYMWNVFMTNGGVLSYDKGGDYGYGYVWPARSGQSGAVQIPQTGQKISYRAGDDGDLEMGIAWPSQRFTDNGNGTVTDNLTGLMWLKDTNCIKSSYSSFDNDYYAGDGAVTWQNALNFIKGINNGTYIDCGAGYSDWRLPNRKELRSLIDYSRYGPALPSGHPFTNVQSGYYWPSTTYVYIPNAAWIVDVWNGYGSQFYKYDDHFIWPVRSDTVGGLDYYCDDDNDGYIDSSIDGNCTGVGCVPAGCQTTAGDDCNDNDPAINPGATEVCNGIDDNCNGQIDEGCTTTNADLFVSSWTVPANACTGATISIKDTTKNQGTGTAGASQACFYFSTNTTLDTGDTPLGCRAIPSLGASAVNTGTTSVTLPNVAIGKYYLIAMADDGKIVSESNETNNKKSKTIYIGPDLYVSALSAPTSATLGATISITDTTKNKGCGTAGASITKFYLSTNTTINIGVDYELGTRPVPSLGTDAVSTGTTDVVIPVGIPTGKYHIITNSDDAKVVVEGNETNNKKTKAITINP